MLNRRGILRLLGGGVAAGATIDPKDVMREVAKGSSLQSAAGVAGNVLSQECAQSYKPDIVDEMMTSVFWDHSEAMSQSYHQMPAHIANKKSWSPAFKQSEAFKEAYQVIRARRELDRNRSLAEKVAKKLGIRA